MREKIRALFFGKRLKDSELKEQKLNLLWGMPVFSSDTISTVSYAGEEILLVLIPVLGTAAYGRFVPIVAALIVLLALLVISYRHTISAYPQGGGAYVVALENLGEKPGLIAGSSLVIEYVLAVAVSVSAAAAAITSAFPAVKTYKTVIAILLIVLLSWLHLRGTRESAIVFGIPTYLFVFMMLLLVAVGFVNWYSGGRVALASPPVPDFQHGTVTLVMLRAFASGCTALAGIEAVSNGVTAFRAPAEKTAKNVLLVMAVIVGAMFFGTSVLIALYHVVPSPYETTISQLARSVFGFSSPMYYLTQFMMVLILCLAANTAFADLPHLMAMMAHDGYLPSRMVFRGSRLNYTNGILFILFSSSALTLAFGANQHTLMPLFASGIFISFFLNQLGMLRHWWRNRGGGWQYKAGINCVVLAATTVTLTVLIYTGFWGGAWVTLLGIALLTELMAVIHNHYERVREELSVHSVEEARELLNTTHTGKAILPARALNRSFIKAYNCAKDLGFSEIEIYYVGASEAEALLFREKIEALHLNCKFVYEITEYRNTEDCLIRHIESEDLEVASYEHLTVLIPNLVTANPLKQPLHNETSRILMQRLSRYHNVYIFQVPYLFE